MRIIDADVHIGPRPEKGQDATIELTIEKMDRAGVEKSLVWLIPPYMRDIEESNAYVYKATREHSDRFLGFGWADPRLGGVEHAKEEAKKCIYEYGFYGVKLNGDEHNFYIDDPKLSLPIIEEIAKTGKALAFHVGANAYEFTHPFRVGKIARMYPEMKILAAHMGGCGHVDLVDAMIEVAAECPNVVLIGSNVHTNSIWKAIQKLGASRVCYGSDTPFDIMHACVGKYRELVADLPVEEQEMIMGGNILRELNA